MLYPKDTEKWKQFTTTSTSYWFKTALCCIPKILKNESNSQHASTTIITTSCCVVSQRYWKMKAIHNAAALCSLLTIVVLYPKDTEKWKQFTTIPRSSDFSVLLCCIPKILKNESNSQRGIPTINRRNSCVVSQRYWKMKAIHNTKARNGATIRVVLYPKDTEKWKQFTTGWNLEQLKTELCCIPKILKNESNSQRNKCRCK